MTTSLKVAIGLYCLVGLFLILGGANYVLRSEYMPYHAQATQVPWESLSPQHQGTYLGLMKGRAAGSITVGLTVILLSVWGLRKEVALSFWMLPVVALAFLAIANYSTWYMNKATEGGPPLRVGLTVMAVACAAAALAHVGRPSGHRT